MTNRKSTRRALLSSVLVLIVCIAMLVGTTFAWFTDSVTSSGNIIQSGTLDVTMEWAYGTEDPDAANWTDASSGPIFESELWEPGYTEVRHIKIENKGSLALKYQLNIIANGEVSKLADVIDVYFVDPAVEIADRSELKEENKLGTLTSVLKNISKTASGNLISGDKDVITLALSMQETAGNEYQGLSIGSDFSIQLMATQYTYEEDSFNDQYDAKAGYNYGKSNVGPYSLNVLSNGVASYDEATKTYSIDVATVAQGGWNQGQGNYYAGYTVNVANYGENATVKFNKADGTEVTWKLADEEKDGFITNGIHQQWTAVGLNSEYRYDINGDGVTDFTVKNDVSDALVEAATADELRKVIESEGVSAVLVNNVDLGNTALTVAADTEVVLDLGGYTLSAKSTEEKASSAIDNKGTLTVKNGTVTYEGIGDNAYGYGTNTINNYGTLIIEDGANVINTTNAGSSNAIDNAPGSVLTVNGGVIKSEKVTIRVRDNANVTINGGEISGTRAVQIHLFQNVKKPTTLTVNGGTLSGDLALYSYAYGSCTFDQTTVVITGGIFNGDVAFGGGNKTATETVVITGGAFNGELGRYLSNDGWEDLSVNGDYVEATEQKQTIEGTAATEILDTLTSGESLVVDEQIDIIAFDSNNVDAQGATVVLNGVGAEAFGYFAVLPDAGEDVTLENLNVTGSGFVEVGHYGQGGGDYVLNNVTIQNLASTLKNGDKGFTLACAFMHYGNATLNNCVMTGTTAVQEGAMPVDLASANGFTTVVNGGKYGTIYSWSHAYTTINGAEVDTMYVAPIKGTVTIKAGSTVGTINVDYGTSAKYATKANLQKFVIEDGATVGAIVFNGTTYTVSEWNTYVSGL